MPEQKAAHKVPGVILLLSTAIILCAVGYFQIKSYRGANPPVINTGRNYPSTHWVNKVAPNACTNCKHVSLIKKHWDKDKLYCENCKTRHKGKIAKHYMYEKALTCMQCGHEGIVKEEHQNSKISCASCKMGHYDHYVGKKND